MWLISGKDMYKFNYKRQEVSAVENYTEADYYHYSQHRRPVNNVLFKVS